MFYFEVYFSDLIINCLLLSFMDIPNLLKKIEIIHLTLKKIILRVRLFLGE